MSQESAENLRLRERYYPPTCPRCASTSGFHGVTMQGHDESWLMLLSGGLVAYLLTDTSHQPGIECERCHFVFRPIKRLTKFHLIATVIITATLLGITAFFLFSKSGF